MAPARRGRPRAGRAGPTGKAYTFKEIARISYRSVRLRTSPSLGVGKDILTRPAGEVEPYPIGEEPKTRCRQIRAPLPNEDGVELLLEGMQVQLVRRRIGELRVGERLSAPIGELLLFREVDAEHLAHQVLKTMLVGIGPSDPRGDLGAIDRRGHNTQALV